MSSVAVGRIRVDGPAPSAPLHNLLSVPGVLQSSAGRWDGGVNIWGYVADVPLTWDACSSGTWREKDEGTSIDTAGFDSFVIYIAQNCSTLGIAANLPDFIRRADAVLNATQSYAIEQALASGVDGLTNPYLGDANLASLFPGTVTAEVGLALLENAIGATGRQGMIHLTPAVASALDSNLSDNGSGFLTTLSGNRVVVGGGYIGVDPDAETASGATTDWIFATGPVQARVSEILTGPDEVQGMVDHEFNDVIYRAEKLVNVSWDTELQAGVLVDWASCCDPSPII